MVPSCWFLLIFAFAAEASTILDSQHHYHDLEDLHNELEDYITGLQKLEVETRETLERVYELEAARALAKHKENTKMLMRLANQKNCPQPALLQLNELSESWSDRISECMNFTQKLVYYENVTASIYTEYLELRPLACGGANDIALCVQKTGSILQRLQCCYDAVQNSASKFAALKNKIVETVKYLQDLLQDTKKEFLGCIGIHHTSLLSTGNDIIGRC